MVATTLGCKGCSIFALALVLCPILTHAADATAPSSIPPNVLDGPELVAALRSGGYVLYFRHGITDQSTSDTDRNNLKNCQSQRRLSEQGREQMRRIGQSIAALGIRVGAVLSSPYCRNIDTATLAFGRAMVENNLRNTVTADEATVNRQAAALRMMLATTPLVPGTNTVLSGHTGNLQEATGIWPEPEGVAIVFRPQSDGNFTFVAAIPPDRWRDLLTHGHESGSEWGGGVMMTARNQPLGAAYAYGNPQEISFEACARRCRVLFAR